jgi:hypothetical protein
MVIRDIQSIAEKVNEQSKVCFGLVSAINDNANSLKEIKDILESLGSVLSVNLNEPLKI